MVLFDYLSWRIHASFSEKSKKNLNLGCNEISGKRESCKPKQRCNTLTNRYIVQAVTLARYRAGKFQECVASLRYGLLKSILNFRLPIAH